MKRSDEGKEERGEKGRGEGRKWRIGEKEIEKRRGERRRKKEKDEGIEGVERRRKKGKDEGKGERE
jgi:hypothetical protein